MRAGWFCLAASACCPGCTHYNTLTHAHTLNSTSFFSFSLGLMLCLCLPLYISALTFFLSLTLSSCFSLLRFLWLNPKMTSQFPIIYSRVLHLLIMKIHFFCEWNFKILHSVIHQLYTSCAQTCPKLCKVLAVFLLNLKNFGANVSIQWVKLCWHVSA